MDWSLYEVRMLLEDVTSYRVGSRRPLLWPGAPTRMMRLALRSQRRHRPRIAWWCWRQFSMRGTSDRWWRTWQAESEGSGLNAERGWTERGAVRRMSRAIRRHYIGCGDSTTNVGNSL